MKGILFFAGVLMLTSCATTGSNSQMQNQPLGQKPSMEPVKVSPKQQAANVTAPPMMGPGY